MAVRGGDEIEGGGPAHHVPANTVHAPAQDYKFIYSKVKSTNLLKSSVSDSEVRQGFGKRCNASSNAVNMTVKLK